MAAIFDKVKVGERLQQLEAELGLNSRQFTLSLEGEGLLDKVDVSYMNKVEKGVKPLSKTYLEAIEKAYHVNRDWLLSGTGNIFSIGTNVPHENRNHQEKRKDFKEAGEEKRGIKIYESAPVHAGFNPKYHDDPEHQVPDYVIRIPQFRDCTYGTRASGDSMYPEIRNGDLIFCKELVPSARIIYGDMYVVHTVDGVETIKYIQQYVDDSNNEPWVLLVPHNKAAGMGTPIPRKEIRRLFKVRAIFKSY